MKVSIEKDTIEANSASLQNELTAIKTRVASIESERKALLAERDGMTLKIYAALKNIG